MIELDDRSHEAEDRQIRDDFLNKALEAAGIPILRVKNRSIYDEAGLASEMRTLLNKN